VSALVVAAAAESAVSKPPSAEQRAGVAAPVSIE